MKVQNEDRIKHCKAANCGRDKVDPETTDEDSLNLDYHYSDADFDDSYDYDDFVIRDGSGGGRRPPWAGSKGKTKTRNREKNSTSSKNNNTIYSSKHVRAKDSLRVTLRQKGRHQAVR